MGAALARGKEAVMHTPHFWSELFAEMEKPGKGGSGLENKTRSNLLPAEYYEAGLGKMSPVQGAQVGAAPVFQVRDSDEADLG